MASEKKAGRPRENRVKVNMLLSRETRSKIDAEINPHNPLKSSRGKVVEQKFQ